MLLRQGKIGLIVLVGLWGLIGGVNNFLDIEGGYNTVAITLNTLDELGEPTWRSVQSPVFIWLAWLFIPLSKLASAFWCFAGARNMWLARTDNAENFNNAKSLALVGCCISMVMLYGGFTVAADNYFLLWKTPIGGLALPQAFRYFASIVLLAIFVQQADQ